MKYKTIEINGTPCINSVNERERVYLLDYECCELRNTYVIIQISKEICAKTFKNNNVFVYILAKIISCVIPAPILFVLSTFAPAFSSNSAILT